MKRTLSSAQKKPDEWKRSKQVLAAYIVASCFIFIDEEKGLLQLTAWNAALVVAMLINPSLWQYFPLSVLMLPSIGLIFLGTLALLVNVTRRHFLTAAIDSSAIALNTVIIIGTMSLLAS